MNILCDIERKEKIAKCRCTAAAVYTTLTHILLELFQLKAPTHENEKDFRSKTFGSAAAERNITEKREMYSKRRLDAMMKILRGKICIPLNTHTPRSMLPHTNAGAHIQKCAVTVKHNLDGWSLQFTFSFMLFLPHTTNSIILFVRRRFMTHSRYYLCFFHIHFDTIVYRIWSFTTDSDDFNGTTKLFEKYIRGDYYEWRRRGNSYTQQNYKCELGKINSNERISFQTTQQKIDWSNFIIINSSKARRKNACRS